MTKVLESVFTLSLWLQRMTFAKTLQIRAFPLHPLCNVDWKHPLHPETLQALSTLLEGGGERAVTKAVSYKQSNRLTQGVFHKCPILRVFFSVVPRTFGQGCGYLNFDYSEYAKT